MAYTVICNKTEFIEFFKSLPFNIGSFYSNSFPYNCMYNQGGNVWSADCWNMIKASIWDDLTLPEGVGSYSFEPGKYGLGDWTGAGILAACTDVSTDFTSITPGEFLLTAAEDHAAIYVGDVSDGTHMWNVVECTPIWANGIQFSWVDPDGTRRQNRGGAISVAWQKHGKLPWVDYSDAPTPTPTPTPTPDPDDVIQKNINIYTVDEDIKKITINRINASTNIEKVYDVDQSCDIVQINFEDVNP